MTNTYATLNPLGSTSPKDLSDNASNFDEAMNSPGPAFIDRFGKRRETWTGLEQMVKSYLEGQGYSYIGEYAAGLTFVNARQYMTRSGLSYRVLSSTPLPYTTTGTWATDQTKFALFSDEDLLRDDLASTSGGTLVRLSNGNTVQEEFDNGGAGADYVLIDGVGDGVADDSAAVIAAIQTGKPVRGVAGKVYGVSISLGNLALYSANVDLRKAAFKDLTPASSTDRRTLFYSGTGKVIFEDLVVDRNGDGNNGALTDSGAIWLAGSGVWSGTSTVGTVQAVVRRCEIFGNGKGNGIVFINASDTYAHDNYIHDMRGGSASHPAMTDDQVHGIWFSQCKSFEVKGNKVRRLTTQFAGQSEWSKYTRGYALGGNRDFNVVGNWDYGSDQSFDITGGPNPNSRFNVAGNHSLDAYTWGFKFANTATEGEVSGNTAYRPGLAGFVASAPTVTQVGAISDDITQNISIHDNIVYDVGRSGNWTSFNDRFGNNIGPAGIMILSNDAYPEFPRGISVHHNHIICRGSTMKYGIANSVAVPSTGTAWNQARDNSIVGATISALFNNNYGFIVRSTGSTQVLAAGNNVNVNFTNVVIDGASMSNGSSGVIAQRAGLYKITGSVKYDSSATGHCTQTILINNAPLPSLLGKTQYANPRIASVDVEWYLAAGVTVSLQVQSSVNANLTEATLSVSEIQCV